MLGTLLPCSSMVVQEIDIGRHGNCLRKHPSNEVKSLWKHPGKWKDLADEWVCIEPWIFFLDGGRKFLSTKSLAGLNPCGIQLMKAEALTHTTICLRLRRFVGN